MIQDMRNHHSDLTAALKLHRQAFLSTDRREQVVGNVHRSAQPY